MKSSIVSPIDNTLCTVSWYSITVSSEVLLFLTLYSNSLTFLLHLTSFANTFSISCSIFSYPSKFPETITVTQLFIISLYAFSKSSFVIFCTSSASPYKYVPKGSPSHKSSSARWIPYLNFSSFLSFILSKINSFSLWMLSSY